MALQLIPICNSPPGWWSFYTPIARPHPREGYNYYITYYPGNISDGIAFAAHPLFSLHSNALQVLFYYDELEVVNPLGSKTKLHKLGMYLYWGLMNFECSYEKRVAAHVQNMFFTYTEVFSTSHWGTCHLSTGRGFQLYTL